MKIDGAVHIYGTLWLTKINSGRMGGPWGVYVVIYGLKVVWWFVLLLDEFSANI